jgi:predicted SAM-dependent methyltransferase
MADPPDVGRSLTEETRALGILLEEIAASLLGFCALPSAQGRLAAPETPILDEMLRDAWLDLLVLHHDMAHVVSRFRTMRATYVQRQVEALGLGANPRDLQISLTGSAPPPWITCGFPPARVVMNLLWGLPFPDGSARFVYFALALEHFYYEPHALAVLRDIRRVLGGGVLRVVVPDIEGYVRAYAAGDEEFFTEHQRFWPWAEHMHTPMDYLLGMSGAGMGRGPGGFFDHKTGYDLRTLSRLLLAAGFARVEPRAYMDSPHPELRIDHVSHDAAFGHGGRSYNLFVEASG